MPTQAPVDSKLITRWDFILSELKSQWGTITYQDWCENEAARIRANGGSAIVRRNKNRECCISRP